MRDKTTGKSKGFAFLAYEDQRSTVLAVDNLNGAKLVGRTLRVDHVKDYKHKTPRDAAELKEMEERPRIAPMGLLPGDEPDVSEYGSVDTSGLDPEDPMYNVLLEERQKRADKDAKKQRKLKDKFNEKPKSDKLDPRKRSKNALTWKEAKP